MTIQPNATNPGGHTATRSIVVNGTACAVTALDLAAALEELGFGAAKVATAVNGTFVPAAKRSQTALQAGDHLDIVAPRAGG